MNKRNSKQKTTYWIFCLYFISVVCRLPLVLEIRVRFNALRPFFSTTIGLTFSLQQHFAGSVQEELKQTPSIETKSTRMRRKHGKISGSSKVKESENSSSSFSSHSSDSEDTADDDHSTGLASNEIQPHSRRLQDQEDYSSSDSLDDEENSSSEEEQEMNHGDHRDDEVATLPIGERLKTIESLEKATQKKKTKRISEQKTSRKEMREQILQKIRLQYKDTAETTEDKSHQQRTGKRSKHAPTEASSKKHDFYRQQRSVVLQGVGVEVNSNRYQARDPRMSGMSGHLDQDQFERNFDFLQEKRQEEIQLLKKQIAARKLTGRKGQKVRKKLNITQDGRSLEDDEDELKRLQQEKAQIERNQIQRAAKRAVKKKVEQEVAEGKRGAYFLKRQEKKRLEAEAKFDEIRKRGGDRAVQKVVSKRRKKNKTRDAAKLLV